MNKYDYLWKVSAERNISLSIELNIPLSLELAKKQAIEDDDEMTLQIEQGRHV